MIRINKEERQYLIDNKFLVIRKGRFLDSKGNTTLYIANKNHKSKDKTYYVLDSYKQCLNGRFGHSKKDNKVLGGK